MFPIPKDPHLKAAKERLEGLRRTLLTLQDRDQRAAVLKEISRLEPEVEARRKDVERLEAEESKANARLQRAIREHDSTQSGLAEARDAYADFPSGLNLSAAAAGFGTGGGTGTFSANVTGQLFNAQLNLNFQGAQATTRYVITVPIPGQPSCDIVLEGQLPRQAQ